MNLSSFNESWNDAGDLLEVESFQVSMQGEIEWRPIHLFLILLNLVVVLGNFIVIFVVLLDRKLRTVTTNKFIASLAVSDLLVGLIVMPLSLYSKVHDDQWHLPYTWCQLHLVSGVFSSTASIVHLVAISLDRYFAIMFPTEYQRHSISTSTFPYVVMIWLMALAVSSTLFMEKHSPAETRCWITNPQYIVLSSLLSFFLPGAIVVYMYIKIFKKLRNHQLYMFGQASNTQKIEKKRSLPRVIIEEVRSRRGSRLSQTGSNSGSPTRRSSGGSTQHKSERSPSQPEIHTVALPPQRWRSPTICAETFEHDRIAAAKKRVSIVPDPPSMDISSVSNMAGIRAEHESAKAREDELIAGKQSMTEDLSGNEVLRKLSEERRVRREERRKSVDGKAVNGIVPIMEAFDKAYQAVKQQDRRRLSLESPVQPFPFSFHPSVAHPSIKPSLSTVCDEESASNENSQDDPSVPTSTIVHVEINPTLPIHALTVNRPINENVPLLKAKSVDSIEVKSIEVQLEDRDEVTSATPLLSVPVINSQRGMKEGNGSAIKGLRPLCANLIPPPTFLMVPAIMSINTPPHSPQFKEHPQTASTLKVPRMYECPSPTACDIPPSNSSHSSYTSASGSSETYRKSKWLQVPSPRSIRKQNKRNRSGSQSESETESQNSKQREWSDFANFLRNKFGGRRRRISMNSFGSSLTEGTDSTFEVDSRRSSAWSTLRAAVLNEPRRGKKSLVDMNIDRTGGQKKMSTISRGKLRKIATQVTRAIRRKRRESLAIRRESRATRVVAAILVAFLMCWIPYYVIIVYRGIITGCGFTIFHKLHHQLYVATSWLGYAHSAFNPIIYMCLNKNFRHTIRRLFAWLSRRSL